MSESQHVFKVVNLKLIEKNKSSGRLIISHAFESFKNIIIRYIIS